MLHTLRREVLAKYATAIDSLPVMAFLMNEDRQVTYRNAEWHRVTGVPKTCTQMFLHNSPQVTAYELQVHPDDVQRIFVGSEAFKGAENGFQDEIRTACVNGTYRWMSLEIAPLRDNVGLFGWIGTLTDIEDLRSTTRSLVESEQQYQILNEAFPGSIYMASPEGAMLNIMDGLNQIAKDPSEKLGDEWISVIHPDDVDRIMRIWKHALATGKTLYSEARFRMTDNSYRWMLSRAIPQRDASGTIIRWVGFVFDIDDRMRLEQQIRRFVAEAARELRAPLTVISGYIDLLNRQSFENSALTHRMFEALSVETKRMRVLVEQLMTLAKLDRDPSGESEVIDLGSIVEDVAGTFRRDRAAAIAVKQSATSLVLGKWADGFYAINNLLENAVNFSRGTQIVVTIMRKDDRIIVAVKDGGPGIPQEEAASIFNRFFRGVYAAGIPGSGLGLAIAARAANRLGGLIALEDARSASTTFSLSIPALDGLVSAV